MKYRLRDKKARNDAIREYHTAHPEITLRELAEMYNISHQRVAQILQAHPNGELKKAG